MAVMERLRDNRSAARGCWRRGCRHRRRSGKKSSDGWRCEDRVDQMPRLPRAAAAQLGDADVRSERGRDLRRLRPQNLILGARDVVLRQLADGREERRAERVIKVVREEKLRRGGESAADILGEAAGRARRRRGGARIARASYSARRRRASVPSGRDCSGCGAAPFVAGYL